MPPVRSAHNSARIPTSAVRIKSPRPIGSSTFHPTFISWSNR